MTSFVEASWRRRWLALAIISFVFLTGARAMAAGGTTPARRGSPAVVTVHDVDWMNGTFDLGDRPYAFTAVRYADLDEDGQCQICLSIRNVSFGDVDGDGQDEAIVLVNADLGGAGLSLDGYLFGMKEGKPVMRAQLEGGDRGDGGIQGVTVAAGEVIVRRFDLSGTDSICCPSRILIERWRWSGDQLVKRPGLPVVRRRKPRWWALRP